MRREICGECDTPINDDGSCICTELLKRGWRQCAKEQKTTQWCQMAEALKAENERLRAGIERLRRGPHPAITHCDNCGCDWLDNGLNPIGCPYCKLSAETEASRRTPTKEVDFFTPGARLALELECLLLDTRNDAAQSRWWDSAHEALEQWRQAVRAMERSV